MFQIHYILGRKEHLEEFIQNTFSHHLNQQQNWCQGMSDSASPAVFRLFHPLCALFSKESFHLQLGGWLCAASCVCLCVFRVGV
jgi:hypothetical protein